MASRRGPGEGRSSTATARWRGVASWAGAIAVHALVLWAGLRAPVAEAPAPPYRDTAVEPIDLEVIGVLAAAEPATAPVAPPPHAGSAPVRAVPGAQRGHRPGAHAAIAPEPSAGAGAQSPLAGAESPSGQSLTASPAESPLPSSSLPSSSSTAQAQNEYSGPAPAVPGLPGVAALQAASASGAAVALAGTAPDVSPRPLVPRAPGDIGGQLLRDDLRKHDHELGLDTPAGGAVVTAVETAVRSSQTPGDAKSNFDVRIDAAGRVSGVTVVSYTAGDAAAWAGVVSAVSGALSGKALPVRGAGAKGAVIHVAVESKVVYPAGHKDRIELDVLCAQDETSRATPPEDRPGPFLAGSRSPSDIEKRKKTFCVPTGVGFRFDLANIGAHRSRQIHARYTVDYLGS
jgi:hypothetical protein